MKAQCGTLRYMSPEQLDGILTSKIDIWAFGCVLLEILTGKPPYSGITNEF
jgi:serine/threonine protein kinase